MYYRSAFLMKRGFELDEDYSLLGDVGGLCFLTEDMGLGGLT